MRRWRRGADNRWSLLETAAFIASLDLVITCDSAIAHLAGVLDIPTWIALPFASEWRWGIGVGRTDWYRHTTLFRQKKYGEWDPVFAEMTTALSETV